MALSSIKHAQTVVTGDGWTRLCYSVDHTWQWRGQIYEFPIQIKLKEKLVEIKQTNWIEQTTRTSFLKSGFCRDKQADTS